MDLPLPAANVNLPLKQFMVPRNRGATYFVRVMAFPSDFACPAGRLPGPLPGPLSRGDRIMSIALTGWGLEQDHQRTREAGFNWHLLKPIDPDELNKVLATSLT